MQWARFTGVRGDQFLFHRKSTQERRLHSTRPKSRAIEADARYDLLVARGDRWCGKEMYNLDLPKVNWPSQHFWKEIMPLQARAMSRCGDATVSGMVQIVKSGSHC